MKPTAAIACATYFHEVSAKAKNVSTLEVQRESRNSASGVHGRG
jgi:hypothetical protein